MSSQRQGIETSLAWRELGIRAEALRASRLRDLFAANNDRARRYTLEAAGVYLDYSKNKFDADTLKALLDLAVAADLKAAIGRMAAGEKVNETEGRAVLHMALRDFGQRSYSVDGAPVAPAVEAERRRMQAVCARMDSGDLRGFGGDRIEAIVNIGIGGSDLGPLMAVEALRPYWAADRRAYFVSNVDGQHLSATLALLDPRRTLFLVASKTFTTEETMTNARSARDWMVAAGAGEADVSRHFFALSTNIQAATAFGVAPENVFGFWDWVGGRYSLWSAIGLSIALQTGYTVFERFLRGAAAMDAHFLSAPLEANMPALLALVGVWNRNFLGAAAHAVLPYDQRLHRLPAYLQQADMESNGKTARLDGSLAPYATGPVIFGEPGTNGQHAFYQLIHQGTDVISSDFIVAARTHAPLADHHEKLIANFLAQTEALMLGRTIGEARAEMAAEGKSAAEIEALAPHKVFPGDRPTNSIIVDELTPEALGALIALYEHKIFCQGVIWGVNSFDQWGVELGKALARRILPEIAPLGQSRTAATGHDGSTNALIAHINNIRSRG